MGSLLPQLEKDDQWPPIKDASISDCPRVCKSGPENAQNWGFTESANKDGEELKGASTNASAKAVPQMGNDSLAQQIKDSARATGAWSASSGGMGVNRQELTQRAEPLSAVLQEAALEVFFPFGVDKGLVLQGPRPIATRARTVVASKALRLRAAAWQLVLDVRSWVEQGGTFRIMLVYMALALAIIGATGLTVFLLVVIACTANALLVAFVLCLAAVGAFLSLFLFSLSAIYVTALVCAAVVVGGFTVSAIALATCLGGTFLVGFAVYQAFGLSVKCTRLVAMSAAQTVANAAEQVEKRL